MKICNSKSDEEILYNKEFIKLVFNDTPMLVCIFVLCSVYENLSSS